MQAILRPPDTSLSQCELSFIERAPIDFERALAEHSAYAAALERNGVRVTMLPRLEGAPDSVFIEDTAVFLKECAILARPGAASREAETASVRPRLAAARATVYEIEAPGRLDGGDVLMTDSNVYVGISSRTNAEGFEQFARIAVRYGYRPLAIEVRGCLHLKTGLTYLGDGTYLNQPAWVDPSAVGARRVIEVADGEPFGANTLRLAGRLLYPAEHPRTAARLRAAGYEVVTTPLRELAKAEAGVTCLSLLF
ncbi:MAG TPA: arginine deiminase family protein [Bdellovibrionales bacterium]|nr:arginine deiminase family protein [Bdellovibrionales bacterium]